MGSERLSMATLRADGSSLFSLSEPDIWVMDVLGEKATPTEYTLNNPTFFQPSDWWTYRTVSDNKLCSMCEPLNNMTFQGHNLNRVFPYLVIEDFNKISVNNHMPRDDHCRCTLVRV